MFSTFVICIYDICRFWAPCICGGKFAEVDGYG